MLTKEEAAKIKPQIVQQAMPALGEEVVIGLRQATVADRAALIDLLNEEGEDGGGVAASAILGYQAKLVARTAVDAEGAPLWSRAQIETLLPHSAVAALADASARHSGLHGGAAEEAAGNSPTTGAGDSSSS